MEELDPLDHLCAGGTFVECSQNIESVETSAGRVLFQTPPLVQVCSKVTEANSQEQSLAL